MNLSGSGQPWIWASKSGDPVRSDSTSANVQQHDDGAYASFKLDMNMISPDNSSNTFLDLSSSQIIDAGDSSAGYDGAAIPIYGVIMCLAFVIGFPIGAFLIRLASFRGLVWIHAGVQLLSYFGAIIGLGLGVYIANKGAADLRMTVTLDRWNSADPLILALLLPPHPRYSNRCPPHLPTCPRLRPSPPISALPPAQSLHARSRLVRPASRHCRVD